MRSFEESLFQSHFTVSTVVNLQSSSRQKSLTSFTSDFTDHGGGHCQHSDKGRLNCYSPIKTGFKIKGTSPNPTEVTLYQYMLCTVHADLDHLDVTLYKSSIKVLLYMAVISKSQTLQIILKARLVYSIFIDSNNEITIFFSIFIAQVRQH